MTKEQYSFCDLFWSDPEWVEGNLPKKLEINSHGDNFDFIFLNDDEMKDFMKLKAKEDPIILNDFRYKKLCRVLNLDI